MLASNKETMAMRIAQSLEPAAVGARRAVERRAGDGGFSGRIGAAPAGGAAAAAAAAVTPLTSLGAILAVQEVDDALAGRRRARQRGEMLLEALDELRHALLDGRIQPGQLEALQKLAADGRGRCDDPALNAVLDEIELRASVELAKLEGCTR